MEWTHIMREAGNGFPRDGEDVLIEDQSGWHKIVRVARTSSIVTRQWEPNYIPHRRGIRHRL